MLTATASVSAQPLQPAVRFLDVPYIQQSELLCGGAAAAMVMRFWGATGIYAESFASLVDMSARGIRGDVLLESLRRRGWNARSFRGDRSLVTARLADRQPVIALIEDRPGFFHFVVIVAWTNARVVYHDPARAPFRVVTEKTFEAAWARSDHWTLLALPPEAGVPAAERAEESTERVATTPCAALVAEGIRAAGTGDKRAALEVFTAAAELCPDESAPLREAAGVYALDEKWSDARRLARAAVLRDPKDEHAWRILATSEYVAGDSAAALAAWNEAGEPRIDLVTVQGLVRTRHAVATGLLDLDVNTVLTTGALNAARRRLSELPSAEVARILYRPLGAGRANVDAVVIEHALLPTSRASLAAITVRLATDRAISASVASVTGGGELVSASWRWWENRPRVEVTYAVPSSRGIWRAEVFGEEQAYADDTAPVIESRRGGSVMLSQWTAASTRWQIASGVDAWRGRGRTVSFGGAVDQRLRGDRIAVRATGSALAGAFSSWTAGAAIDARNLVRHEGLVVAGRVGMDAAAENAPRALWSGAGTGHARVPLLRGHTLLEDGRIAGDVFGRRLYHAGAEVRRWLKPAFKLVRLAPAVFLDVARADRRTQPGNAWHADAGAGVRVALPGSGVLRLDVGKGLRDGSTAFSVGWTR